MPPFLESLVRTYVLPTAIVLSPVQVMAQPELPHCGGPQECFRASVDLDKKGRYTQAAEYLKKSREQETDIFRRAILLFNIGLAYEKGGEPDNALEYFELFAQEDPESLALVARRRAEDMRAKGIQKEAMEVPSTQEIEQWKNALESYSAGKRKAKKGEFSSAIDLYRTALIGHLSSDCRVTILRDLGEVYDSNNQPREALEHYVLYLQKTKVPVDQVEIQSRVKELQEIVKNKGLLENKSPLENRGTEEHKHQSPAEGPHQVKKNPLTSVPDHEEPESLWQKYRWAIVSGATSTALLAGSAALHYVAEGEFDNLEKSCGPTPEGCSDGQIDGNKHKFQARNALLITGALGAAVTGGLVVWKATRGKQAGSKLDGKQKASLSIGNGVTLKIDY